MNLNWKEEPNPPGRVTARIVMRIDWSPVLDPIRAMLILATLQHCVDELSTAGIDVDYWTTNLDSLQREREANNAD